MTALQETGLDRAKRARAQMSAAHAMVLALHGPADKDCVICEWLSYTAARVTALEAEVATYIGGTQAELKAEIVPEKPEIIGSPVAPFTVNDVAPLTVGVVLEGVEP